MGSIECKMIVLMSWHQTG